MTTCNHCGVSADSNFCPNCGNRKSAPVAAPAMPLSVRMVQETHDGNTIHAQALQLAPAAYGQPPSNPQANLVPSVPVQRSVQTFEAGQLSGNIHAIGNDKVTGTAAKVLNQSDEAMGWQGAPSIYVLIPLTLKYFGAFFFTTLLFRNGWVSFLLLFAAAIHILLRYYEISRTAYKLSSQRLEVTSGLFNRLTVAFEVHQLGDAVIYRPFYLDHFQVANVQIAGGPTLFGVANPEMVRDVLREFGQIEASRLDKYRWRS
jgi:hypothetical protein